MVLVGLALSGCGGSPTHGASGTRRPLLARTFGATRDTPTSGDFEFGDIAAQRSLAGVPPLYSQAGRAAKKWLMVLGVGAFYFYEDPSGKRDGLDILTGDLALSIGTPPHTAALINGPLLSGARVRSALMRLGARAGTVAGRPGLVWGAEGSEHLNAADVFGVGPALGEFDRSVITTHTVIAGRYAADVGALAGGGASTVGENPTLHATITCLGDVIAARGMTGTANGATEVAAGVRRPASAASAGQEVLCAVRPASVSGAFTRSACSRVSPTAPPLPSGLVPGNYAVSTSAMTGTTDGREWLECVITDKPSTAVGWLLQTLNNATDLMYLLGLT